VAISRQNDLRRMSNECAVDLQSTRDGSSRTVTSGNARQSALTRSNAARGIATGSPCATMSYRPNAARVAAAVALKYSGGRMKPHSWNLTRSVMARR